MNTYKHIKRSTDIIAAAAGLLLLSPIFLAISVILSVRLKKSPFFIQPRPGLNNKIFNLIKFQTMIDLKDDKGFFLEDHLRITKFGQLLRNTSLDEIPQLFNVIKGDMSIVGPRPLLVDYLKYYTDYQKQRHNVKPGITGWAQVNGRNKLKWEDKFQLDVEYIENVSFTLDIRILVLTIIKIFNAKDNQYSPQTTMTTFKGDESND